VSAENPSPSSALPPRASASAQLTAMTYTWYYPFFAVAIFLLGVELLKIKH
jgi:hypothetical protein